jgi:hypothetical protein
MGNENPISIASPYKLRPEAIRTINCEIKADKNCNAFLVTATKTGKSEIIIHKYGKALKGNEKEEELLRFKYRNILFPDPLIDLKERFGNFIGTGYMRAQMELSAYIPGTDLRATVESFKVIILAKDDENPLIYTNKGGRFTGGFIKHLWDIRPGHKIIFEDIRMKCPGDKVAR